MNEDKILVVEYDEPLAKQIEKDLEKKYNSNVALVNNKDIAMDKLKKLSNLELIIINVNSDGIDIAKEARKNEHTSDKPIIFIMPKDLNRGEGSIGIPIDIASGYTSFIEEPYHITKIIDKIEKIPNLEDKLIKAEKIDKSIINLFHLYLKKHFNSSDPERELTISQKEYKKYFLKMTKKGFGGKYGLVSFFELNLWDSKTSHRFAIKKNIEMFKGDDPKLVTSIEFKVLTALQEILRDPKSAITNYVADYCCHRDDIIMTRRIDGDTLQDYITKHKVLPPEIAFYVIETMPKIHDALSEIITKKKGIHKENALSYREINFLKKRRINMIQSALPAININEIRKNFYAYRIVKEAGMYIPEFIKSYHNINYTLEHAKKTWIGYDHPRNRIVTQPFAEAPYRVISYDYNHISLDFFGLDTAMFLLTLKPEETDKGYNNTFNNYMNLAIIAEFLNTYKNDLSKDNKNDIKKIIKQIKNPDYTNEETKDISVLYKHNQILIDSACMHAAFMHQTTLELIKLINYNQKDNVKERAIAHVQSLKNIEDISNKFYENLNDKQRDILKNAKAISPVSCKSLVPLKNSSLLKPYITKLMGYKR